MEMKWYTLTLAAFLAAFALPASASVIVPGTYEAGPATYWEFTPEVGFIVVGLDFEVNAQFQDLSWLGGNQYLTNFDPATLNFLAGPWGDGGVVEFDTVTLLTEETGQPGEGDYQLAYSLWGTGHFVDDPQYLVYIQGDYDGFPAVGGGDDYVTLMGGVGNLSFTIREAVVPEPSSILLCGIGLSLFLVRRRLSFCRT